ncbi:hypothetical protein G6F57_017735 [Rhizopus arrhizus]|nr:hypothetical protein G6F57_017735 [Rhizopus arrhizus]
MIKKSRNVARLARANEAFRESFANVGKRLEMLADDAGLAQRLEHASLWRLYRVAVNEIRTRRAQGADTTSISAATIEAIRASMDAVRTKENQALGAKLGSLSNAIAGGPYIGLLGTVLGIMVVFLGTAMAGDVNINAIAPGYMATDNTAQLRADQDRNKAILDRIPAGRWGTPDDLAGAAVFLASSASDYINGAVLPVDGGWLAR